MWYVIKLLYCNMSIDYVDSHTPYFDVFVWRFCSIPEEVRRITTQSILSYAGDTYVILIGKAPRLFLVTWIQKKSSCDIINDISWNFAFTIEIRCISTCSLNYDVHGVTCIHEFRRYCQCSIFINSDKCNCLILINQYIDKKFEDVKRWKLSSGWKTKGIWSSTTHTHKSWGKSTDDFYTEKRKTHMKHEPREEFQDISGRNSWNFSCLGSCFIWVLRFSV